ncbi:MAG: hypothetical protein A3I17_04490 [Candidatus Rokubacteria bacterium RIFCSPLOWO2_02_FULL_72_37]|nr:MAG: hypothetical protein A3I17_04490 [Candidatus Rokubacteria bacterium RIFCSPLOWO2_02_FULL_72_37]
MIGSPVPMIQRWPCSTPLGVPVVPDEYTMNAGSSGPVTAGAASSPARAISVPSVRAGSPPSPPSSTWRRRGAPPRAASTTSRASGATTATVAALFSRIAPTSVARSMSEVGIGTAPSFEAPRNASMQSRFVPRRRSTRSPRPIPSPASAFAARLERRRRSSKV